MAKKNLYPEEMVQISGGWLDPANEGHLAILQVPLLNALLPSIGEAHTGVIPLVKAPPDDLIAAIIIDEAGIDYRHDGIIRGTHGALTAMAELVGGECGAELIALRDTLIPDGLQSMLKSYRAEHTQAIQLEERLIPSLRARTDAILIGEGAHAKPLTAYVQEWIALGKQLGALEDKKARLEAGLQETVPGAAALKARNQWVRVVNALEQNAELLDLDEKVMAIIFGPVWSAERKADERVRAAAARAQKDAPTEETAATEKTGDKPAGDKPAGDKPAAGDKPSGDKPAGDKPAADQDAGDKPAADKAAKPVA